MKSIILFILLVLIFNVMQRYLGENVELLAQGTILFLLIRLNLK